MEYAAIFALIVCAVAIYISIKIYRDLPKIDKKIEEKWKEEKRKKKKR